MIELIPMCEAEFEPFMKISMRSQAQDQVKAGEWKAEEADTHIQKLRQLFLPEGLNTPKHFFFTLEENEINQKVGVLWFTIVDQDDSQLFYVMDILIYPEYRRHGYASQAFLQMETKALEMGINRIGLNVFKHNAPARAMYEKLGYIGSGNIMTLEIKPKNQIS